MHSNCPLNNCVLSPQMSSGSLTAHWQTRPSWRTVVWCPCRTPLLVSTGHILWTLHGLLKVQASITHTKYAGFSLRNTIFTAVYGLDPFNMLCDLKIAAHCYGMNSKVTWYFFHEGCTDPLTLDIFVPDKWSQMSLCLSKTMGQIHSTPRGIN